MNTPLLTSIAVLLLALAGCARTPKDAPVFQSYGSPAGPNGSAVISATPMDSSLIPTTATTRAETKVVAAADRSAPVSSKSKTETPVVTLAEGITGKISSANEKLKFVVLTFPVGQMAKVDQRLNVFRAGLKVGELTVTGPQREDSIVADISAGEARAGDEVRDR
jgi:hypothetical protein